MIFLPALGKGRNVEILNKWYFALRYDYDGTRMIIYTFSQVEIPDKSLVQISVPRKNFSVSKKFFHSEVVSWVKNWLNLRIWQIDWFRDARMDDNSFMIRCTPPRSALFFLFSFFLSFWFDVLRQEVRYCFSKSNSTRIDLALWWVGILSGSWSECRFDFVETHFVIDALFEKAPIYISLPFPFLGFY